MKLSIAEFPLSRFDETVPLLLRCFPDFWNPRLERGMRSFPYDLKFFTMELDSQRIGCVGLHFYHILINGNPVHCFGVSDVAVDPAFRGRGYSRELLKFVLEYSQENAVCGFMPLYTDKPGVYTGSGWSVYTSDRSSEIRTEDFPKKDVFHLDPGKLRLRFLQGECCAETPEEETASAIMKIYRNGKLFCGKTIRSGKTWLELFSDPEYEWRLEENVYFLYRGDILYEAYSVDTDHPVSCYTPRHGGHDSNKVMVNFSKTSNQTEETIAAGIRSGKIVFPAADVF